MDDVEPSEIETEFAGAEFGDRRLGARLVALARSMAAELALSFPRALSPAELVVTYRFLNNVKVTSHLTLRPHVAQALSRIIEHAEVLIAHDGSTISFTSDGSREGLVPARREVVYAIVALGGRLKHNGVPGWQTLAHGYERPHSVLEDYRIGREVEAARSSSGWTFNDRAVRASSAYR